MVFPLSLVKVTKTRSGTMPSLPDTAIHPLTDRAFPTVGIPERGGLPLTASIIPSHICVEETGRLPGAASAILSNKKEFSVSVFPNKFNLRKLKEYSFFQN